jgi:L-lysine 2,3-aminomutase
MIPAKRLPAQPARWQQLWREAISDPRELLQLLDLSHLADTLPASADTGFALRVPRGFAARMRRGDAADPLLLQVLPQAAELGEVPGFTRDAVGDLDARGARGVLHKYRGRALLIATGSCAINCRYCFRRHFPYAEETAAANRWQEAIAQLRGDASIGEVILSGGDPLSLSTPKLAELTDALAGTPHIRRLRIHANELDESVAAACAGLREAGATVLNQSVLLRAVNDSVDALQALSERLFDCGVLPYYLHQLDRVQGTAHFEVTDARALALIEELGTRVPGYLLPRLVREVAGAPAKMPL